MALAEVNTQNKWLSSVTTDDFQHGIDIDRYKTFISEGISKLKSLAKEMLGNIWNTLSKAFSGIASLSKTLIMDTITGVLNKLLGIGNDIMSMLGIKSALSTVCGNFDAGLYNRYGGNFSAVNALGLMGLMSSLLCMGVDGILNPIKDIAKSIGLKANDMVGVVSNTMDALAINPVNTVVNGLSNNVFDPIARTFTETKFNVGGILNEITEDLELSSAFKNTSTSKRLLTGYSGDNYELYADTLLPNWDINDLASSSNATKSFLNKSKSSVVTDTTSIGDFSKKDFMMIL